jgi:hypothetical protein
MHPFYNICSSALIIIGGNTVIGGIAHGIINGTPTPEIAQLQRVLHPRIHGDYTGVGVPFIIPHAHRVDAPFYRNAVGKTFIIPCAHVVRSRR